MGGRFISGALAALALCAVAEPAAAACKLDGLAQLPVTMVGMRPSVPVSVNGQAARLFVDTGGQFGILTERGAERLGLRVTSLPDRAAWMMGATGLARLKFTRVETLSLVGFPVPKVEFYVGGGWEWQVDGSLAQDVLGGMDAEYDMANGAIRFFSVEDCKGQPLAYWDKDQSYSELDLDRVGRSARRIQVIVQINGQDVRAELDSGTDRSILSTRAAERIGVGPKSAGATPAGSISGIGLQAVDTWLVPVDSFKVGQEEIRHTRLRVGALQLDRAEMLLGEDFFLSHRIFVSRSQAKVYLTYNGGPVFRLDKSEPPSTGAAPSPAASQPVQVAAAAAPLPVDADGSGYARRAAAMMARRDYAGAEAAYTLALERAPKDVQHLLGRAGARARSGRTEAALADLDQALTLKPGDKDALLMRGSLRLKAKDEAGGRADLEAAAKQSGDYRFFVADAYEEAGLFAGVVGQYDAWIAEHPKDKYLPSARFRRCRARVFGGTELDQALADCNAALDQYPDAMDVLTARGLVRLRQAKYDLAIADFDLVLKQKPTFGWSLQGRGLARLRKGLKADGEADLKAAAAADPGLPEFAKTAGLAP